jgi:hypothetical protein
MFELSGAGPTPEATTASAQHLGVEMKKLITALASVGIACLAFAASPAAASGSSCPPGNCEYVLWDVDTEPYQADNEVDEQGNADGWACAKPTKVVLDENGNPFQIYSFIDNRVADRVTET